MKYGFKNAIASLLICALTLTLIGCGNKNILFKDDTYTITKTDKQVVIAVNDGASAPSVHNAAKEYIDTACPCLYVLDYSGATLTVSSHDYDGDAKDNYTTWELCAADGIIFNMISVVDDKGIVTVDSVTIPQEEHQYVGEYYTGGFFEFNALGEVSCITFYGETVIQ